MNVDFVSDLHMEINGNVTQQTKIPEGERTDEDILILAGDITCYRYFNPNRTDPESRSMRKRFAHFIQEKCGHYKHILYIPGNHEYYGTYFEGADDEFQHRMDMIDGRIIVANNYVHKSHPGLAIICSTFWMGFASPGDPYEYLIKRSVEQGMNDFHTIAIRPDDKMSYIDRQKKIGGGPQGNLITADYIQGIHHKSFKFIRDWYQHFSASAVRPKIIVATHHGCSMMSHNVHRFGDSDLRFGFLTEYGNWIADTKIDYWIHGHTHHNVDYEIGDCKIKSAMYGYLGHDRNLSDKHMEFGRIIV